MLFGQNRREMRNVFFRSWQRHCAHEPLEGAEKLLIAVALRHPEYHTLLDAPETNSEREYFPELGETNPFLHMAMHMAIEEQLALNRPPGIRQHFAALCAQAGDDHAAQHRVMECLGEALWRAGRNGGEVDQAGYLECLARSGGESGVTE